VDDCQCSNITKLKKEKEKRTPCRFGGAIVASSAQNLLCLCSFGVAVWATVMIFF
jgi:hypothetical protein